MIARVESSSVLAADTEHKLRLRDEAANGINDERLAMSQPRDDRASKPKQHQHQHQSRPDIVRRSTDPSHTTAALSPAPTTTTTAPISVHTRTKSPYKHPYAPRGHLRSRSSNSAAPPMSRPTPNPSAPFAFSAAQSSPSPAASPNLLPLSPARSPGLRSISPFHPPLEDTHSPSMTSFPSYDGSIESISEDAELDIAPRITFDQLSQPIPLHATLNSARPLAVRRQRPTSPLHALGGAAYTPHSSSSRSSSGASSPSLPPGPRFVSEGYPTLNHYASNSSFSSVPSTPTSTRSRSPSVSSLETIEDVPDAEWEAIEADRLAKLREAAEASEDGSDGESRRRGSLDIPGARSGVGFGFGRRGDNSKKRWSVCGGERRADLDLETIWED